MITEVRVKFFKIPDNVELQFGRVGIYKLGYFWFIYGDCMGKLQWINFKEQVFFPEVRGADNFGWAIAPGAQAYCRKKEIFIEGLPAAQVAGELINPLKGAFPSGRF